MCAAIVREGGSTSAEVSRARSKYLALTVSNQIAWNALARTNRFNVLRSAIELAPLIFTNAGATARAIAATLLPRVAMEQLLLFYARRQAFTMRTP
jgi:hypothetical protein